VTLTLEYDTAKAQIVAQDSSAVIQAFMAGRIKIEGDMAKVLGLATGQIASETGEALTHRVAAELQAITE
jgi:putative sterol carrier protein